MRLFFALLLFIWTCGGQRDTPTTQSDKDEERVLKQQYSSAASKRCVFVHGSGETLTAPPSSEDTNKYWGGTANVVKFTGGLCSSLRFVHQDTTDRTWDESLLVEAVCAAAVGENAGIEGRSAAANTIKDAYIFTHSMGNLVLAAGIRDNVCRLDASSQWFTLSPPWRGSKAADWVGNVCADPSLGNAALRWLAKELNYCDGTNATIAYQSMKTTYPGITDGRLVKVASQYARGGICGTSDYGLTSSYSLAMEALSHEVQYGEDNDGMVGISDCLLADKIYTTSYTSLWYKAAINHADATLRDGDGDFGSSSRQPGLWFSHLQTLLQHNVTSP